MKKLNNYLLTHYPLLWNLRLHWLWPAVLLIHLLFWLAGYGSVSFPPQTSYYDYSMEPGGGAFSMAVLCGLLLLALWLIFYFRNNAFKSFYPLAKGRLAAEFGLILMTAIGLTTFVASYAGGSYTHIRLATRNVDLTADANTVNLAHHFLPFTRDRFSITEDCGYQRTKEPVPASPYDTDSADAAKARNSGTTADTFSYLHFCENSSYYTRYGALNPYELPDLRSPQGNDSIAKRWLYTGQKDSIARLLNAYLQICKKYNGDYRYDVAKGVDEIFATPGFLVRGFISDGSDAAEHFSDNNNKAGVALQPGAYIDDRQCVEALSMVHTAREGWLRWGIVLAFLYFSLGIGLLVFSFRVTSVRVWFIALIGMAVWMAIFGVLGAVMHHGDGVGLMLLFLLLAAGFLVGGIVSVRAGRSKRNAGIMLLWSMWASPAVALIITALISKVLRPEYESRYDLTHDEAIEKLHPAYYWIENNWTLINYFNVAFTLCMICLVFIPLMRRWQAAPEE